MLVVPYQITTCTYTQVLSEYMHYLIHAYVLTDDLSATP